MKRATGKLSLNNKEIFFGDIIMDWQGSKTINGVRRNLQMLVEVKEKDGGIVLGVEEYLWAGDKKPILVENGGETDRQFYMEDMDESGNARIHYIWDSPIKREGNTLTYPKDSLELAQDK